MPVHNVFHEDQEKSVKSSKDALVPPCGPNRTGGVQWHFVVQVVSFFHVKRQLECSLHTQS